MKTLIPGAVHIRDKRCRWCGGCFGTFGPHHGKCNAMLMGQDMIAGIDEQIWAAPSKSKKKRPKPRPRPKGY